LRLGIGAGVFQFSQRFGVDLEQRLAKFDMVTDLDQKAQPCELLPRCAGEFRCARDATIVNRNEAPRRAGGDHRMITRLTGLSETALCIANRHELRLGSAAVEQLCGHLSPARAARLGDKVQQRSSDVECTVAQVDREVLVAA